MSDEQRKRIFQVSLSGGRVWPSNLLVECEHISEVPELVLKRVHSHGKFEFRLIRWVGYVGDVVRPKVPDAT